MLDLFKIYFFLGALVLMSADADVSCQANWYASQASGSCIQLSSDIKSWDGARSVCQSQGGDLLKIGNAEMNEFVANAIDSTGTYYYWIGLHDTVKEDMFVWLDETTEVNYTNWYDGQPNNHDYYNINGQDCVITAWTSYALDQWGDENCDLMTYYICETFPNGSTEDTSKGETTVSLPGTSASSAVEETNEIQSNVFSSNPTSGEISAGVIAGIVIVCVAIVLVPVAYLAWRYYKTHRLAVITEGYRDTVAFVKDAFPSPSENISDPTLQY